MGIGTMSLRLVLLFVVTLTAVSALGVITSEDDGQPIGRNLRNTMFGHDSMQEDDGAPTGANLRNTMFGHDSMQEDDGAPTGTNLRNTMFGHDSMQARDLNSLRSVLSSSVRDYDAKDKDRAIANAIGSLDEMLEKQSHSPYYRGDAMVEAPMVMGNRWKLRKGDQKEGQQVDENHEEADGLVAADAASLRRRAMYARAYKRASLAMQTKRALDDKFKRQPRASVGFRGRDQIWRRLNDLVKPPGSGGNIGAWRGRDASQGPPCKRSSSSRCSNITAWRGRDQVVE